MAWILLCKQCQFCEKICYNSGDIEFFLGDYFLLAHPVAATDRGILTDMSGTNIPSSVNSGTNRAIITSNEPCFTNLIWSSWHSSLKPTNVQHTNVIINTQLDSTTPVWTCFQHQYSQQQHNNTFIKTDSTQQIHIHTLLMLVPFIIFKCTKSIY